MCVCHRFQYFGFAREIAADMYDHYDHSSLDRIIQSSLQVHGILLYCKLCSHSQIVHRDLNHFIRAIALNETTQLYYGVLLEGRTNAPNRFRETSSSWYFHFEDRRIMS